MEICDFSKFNKLALAQLVQVGLCGRHDAVRCGAVRSLCAENGYPVICRMRQDCLSMYI